MTGISKIGKTLVLLIMIGLLQACIGHGKYTVKVHKPVKHNKPYNHKKDKNSKRLKIVKMKP